MQRDGSGSARSRESRLRGVGVPERALARREVRVQGGGDQRVRERELVVAVHEARGAQRVGGTGGVATVQAHQAGRVS